MIKFKALVRAAVIVVLYFLCGCLGKGTSGGRLYFEPPDRLIDDYTGMVEVMELNWAWAQPGFKLDNYQSLSLNPVINLTGVKDNGIARRVDEKLAAWFAENGFSLSESGHIACEGAIVALKLDRSFTEKKYLFREKAADLFLEMEFVIKEMPSQNTLCKIRHGTVASKSDQLTGQLISGLLSYFETHR
jgi:hypothetical protein